MTMSDIKTDEIAYESLYFIYFFHIIILPHSTSKIKF